MIAFWQSLALITVAEMGDKSQLVALAFATRFRPAVVLLGVTIATLTVHLFSVFVGRFIDSLLPENAVTAAAGLAFIAFGGWSLRGDTLQHDPTEKRSRWGPLLVVTFTFFIAELGDKTMLATITLATGVRR